MGPDDLLKMHVPIERLTSSNFESWIIRIEALFAGRQISDALEKDYPAATAAEHSTFQKNDKAGMAIIIQTVSDEYLRLIKGKTCKQAIQLLKDRLERTGALGRLYARREFQSLKYSTRDNLSSFIIKFDSCVERMESGGLTVSEEEKITQLLMAMPTEFNSVITAIETMAARDDTITVEFVKNRLLDEEVKQKKGNTSNHGRDVAFVTCYHCGKKGHIKKDCRSRYHSRRHNERGSHEYNDRRTNTGRSPGARDKQNRQDSNNSRRNDRDKPSGGARTAEADDEEDVVTFCSLTDTACNIAKDTDVHFVLDSGASHHMIREDLFSLTHNQRKLEKPIIVKVAKANQAIIVSETADINLRYKGRIIQLTDVLCAPQLKCNLLSIRRLEEKGFQVEFKNGCGHIYKGDDLIIRTQASNNLYNIKLQTTLRETGNWANLTLDGDQTMWHRRLGHSRIIKTDGICRTCIEAKISKQPHTGTRPRSKQILDKIHVDLCGPISPTGINGEKYFLTIVDDYSHFTVVYPIRNKNEAHEKLEDFKCRYENNFGRRIKAIRCDAGTEFVNEAMRKTFKNVEFEITPPYTHALNGVAERANRTITEMARAMIIDKNVEKYLWPYATMYSAYALNRLPSKAVDNEIPARRAKIKVDYGKIRIFGCDAYSLVEKQFRNRFDSKTRRMKLVGITNTGYKVYDPINRKVYTRSDVKFIEEDEKENRAIVELDLEERTTGNDNEDQTHMKKEELGQEDIRDDEDKKKDKENEAKKVEPTKRVLPQRSRAPPVRYGDYRAHLTEIEEMCEEDLTYDEALKNGWKSAIDDETRNILENKTWEPVQDSDQPRIDAVWKFKTKMDTDGKEIKKARLVARGCKQNKNESAYAHVPSSTTIKIFLAIVANRDLKMVQMDVKAAYLNSYLNEEIYMIIPRGFPKEGELCKLRKAIYGLRQASQAWINEFESFMKENRFSSSEADVCLYRREKSDKKGTIYVLNYVDDILIASPSTANIEEFKLKIKKRYKTREIGEIKRFVGLEINRTEDYVTISQAGHIKKLLKASGLEMAKPRSVPMEPKTRYNNTLTNQMVCDELQTKYRKLIGNLLYISQNTRPDVTYAINYLSRFQNKPTEEHFAGVKRVIRYLSGTVDYGLLFAKNENEDLHGYADASWGEDVEDRKSTTGYCFMVCEKPIQWRSCKQSVVALSSCEAEYISLSEAIREGRYIQALCRFLDLNVCCYTMFEDNQSAIAVATNTESRRGKSIDIRFHSVREAVKKGEIKLEYVQSQHNVADMLTKPLGPAALNYVRKKIGIVNLREVKI